MTRLDQHFLRDARLARRLARLCPAPDGCTVLEVGPGRGALTRPLQARYRLLAVEADAALAAALPPSPRLAVRAGNILALWGSLAFDGIASNLPYSLCEPFWRLLLKRPVPTLVVVSRSFADKITGTTLLGALTAAVFTVERPFEIPPSSFEPPPKTWSVALRLVPHPSPARGTALGAWHGLLYLDRKKLRNALPLVLPGTKREAKAAMAGLPAKVFEKKVWQLSQVEFAKVDQLLRGQHASNLGEETLVRLLTLVIDRLQGRPIRWRLDGSCNLKVQGLDVSPRDLDLITDTEGLDVVRDAFKDDIVNDAPISHGHAHLLALKIEGIKVDIIDDPALNMLKSVQHINWRGLNLPILPLPQAKKYYAALGRLDKVTLIAEHCKAAQRR